MVASYVPSSAAERPSPSLINNAVLPVNESPIMITLKDLSTYYLLLNTAVLSFSIASAELR